MTTFSHVPRTDFNVSQFKNNSLKELTDLYGQ